MDGEPDPASRGDDEAGHDLPEALRHVHPVDAEPSAHAGRGEKRHRRPEARERRAGDGEVNPDRRSDMKRWIAVLVLGIAGFTVAHLGGCAWTAKTSGAGGPAAARVYV